MKTLKKYAAPIFMIGVFEAIAITLWLTLNNVFYFFNFTHIGGCISIGLLLYIKICKADSPACGWIIHVSVFGINQQ